MDKRVIFAVAGSGKTTYLINQLNLEKRFLLITYTNNNVHNLKTSIINKFGYFPENIKLYSYYTFLYSYCYKPFLSMGLATKGINFEPNLNKYAKKDSRAYYIDSNNRLYSSRISKLLLELNEIPQQVKERISKYFDFVFIDEVQDFGGNDFNLLKLISKAEVNQLYVGDFFQHTFDTSRDGNVNSTLHDNFDNYKSQFEKMGLTLDTKTLSKSYRCSPTICKFITEQLQISIESHKSEETSIIIIDKAEDATSVFNNPAIVKLFYREHYKYDCFSRNWGDSKGEDKYYDVCVVLNKTTMNLYSKGKLSELPPTSMNKFYVALSRTKNNLYLIPDSLLSKA